ncbi:aldehyde dehydrogenase-like protein yneI [Glaciecola punicea ACAM 611]|jgi:succinate-semialdehyde dehydrogenase/glutarate-semialdehyde dehydrogenase|uniref:Aldehyde dehydrogenase-like protein yneI n=1 Tax=Glaciecola punicea ACAM 611 TaxID=1121923 RepID=H5TES4_9ALTE|nr:NAD-dependent succinate-semialdehyde dehydrogenase [Glaciecola punicea]OFA32660.1 succinate-semialdehyde dehydrogenase [Glaciecola punicea]GAB56851.1 aldehyde dehydrogenase-like protein yneI [Glaciecola punicea ACAM 611]
MSNTRKTINPYTEEILEEYTLMSQQECENAIENAHNCFEEWKLVPVEKRAKLALALAGEIEKNHDEILQLMMDEMGKIKAQGKQELALCIAICKFTAQNALQQLANEEREYEPGRAIVSYQPIGVILGIQPWNFPLYQVIRYSISNLVAGNTTVMKHASNVFGMAQKIQTLYENAGFPEYAYQSLIVDGKTASKLIKHGKIMGVTFTGSDETGKSVAQEAAKYAKKTVLELGSNDAYLVLDDADIPLAIETCVIGRVINNGETCVSAKRFIVTKKNYDEFKEGFKKAMENIKFGDPKADDTDLGPMARKDLRDELHDQVSQSITGGATIVCGCEIPEGKGYFYPASILENVMPHTPAYDDELFGPVASLIKAQDDEDAMRIANDSRYGLGGGIFSRDEDKAVELALKHFNTGMININGYGLAHPNLPFGGVKNSGYGREHGGFGIKEFVNIKAVMITNTQ